MKCTAFTSRRPDQSINSHDQVLTLRSSAGAQPSATKTSASTGDFVRPAREMNEGSRGTLPHPCRPITCVNFELRRPDQETTAAAIAALDSQFPWLRGAERHLQSK